MSTMILRRAAMASTEEEVFWGLVQWAERSHGGAGPSEALRIALCEDATPETRWLAALLLDADVRDQWFDLGRDHEDFDWTAWVSCQELDVLTALPGTLRLAYDYARLMCSISATIRIARELDSINKTAAAHLRDALNRRAPLGVHGITAAPFFC